MYVLLNLTINRNSVILYLLLVHCCIENKNLFNFVTIPNLFVFVLRGIIANCILITQDKNEPRFTGARGHCHGHPKVLCA